MRQTKNGRIMPIITRGELFKHQLMMRIWNYIFHFRPTNEPHNFLPICVWVLGTSSSSGNTIPARNQSLSIEKHSFCDGVIWLLLPLWSCRWMADDGGNNNRGGAVLLLKSSVSHTNSTNYYVGVVFSSSWIYDVIHNICIDYSIDTSLPSFC